MLFRVRDYTSSRLDGKNVDPDCGVHANELAQKEKKLQVPLPSEGWTSNLCQLPPFNCNNSGYMSIISQQEKCRSLQSVQWVL